MDYDYIKNHSRFLAVDLSTQEKLDADPKEFQQIDFVGQLKSTDDVNVDGTQSMFVLTILEKIKKKTTKILSRKCNSLMKDCELRRSKS